MEIGFYGGFEERWKLKETKTQNYMKKKIEKENRKIRLAKKMDF